MKSAVKFESLVGPFLVILACTFWAFDALIRYPLMQGGVSAIDIVFYEHLILTSIFMVVFFKSLKSMFTVKIKHFLYFFIVGGVGSALATLAFTRSFYFLNPSLVIILQKFQPVVAIILARLVLKEQIHKMFLFWAGVCLIGGTLVSAEDLIKVFQSQSSWYSSVSPKNALLGYILVAISVIGWGAATVFGKKLGQEGFSDEQIMAGRFSVGFLCLLPFVTSSNSLFQHNVEVYGKISLMVLVSGLLAMYVYYQGLRRVSARACALAEMFFPFMAVIVNWLVLGATLGTSQIVGGFLLLTASLVIQIKKY